MDASDRQAPTPDVVAEARKRVCDRVDELAEVLVATSHAIHAEPELNFEESRLLCRYLSLSPWGSHPLQYS